MDEQLNRAPCGFLTLSENGEMLAVNQTLLKILDYKSDQMGQLQGKHVTTLLTPSAKLFYQIYFVPLIKLNNQIEEMYISLQTKGGAEIPVLINAIRLEDKGRRVIECVLIPMYKRSEYENELLIAKKEADAALAAKNKANAELEVALSSLRAKQKELVELNNQNQKYKIETKKELELARKIQKTSLTDPIINDRLHIETYHKASSELSGDIYGFYQIEPHRYGIIILDVMGHGISSSLITMSLHSLFHRMISKGMKAEIVMKELDNHLHTLFHNNEEAWHYCTAIYLSIDTNKQEIEYINAGHPPALWQDASRKQVELQTSTLPIGAFEGIDFKTNTLTYSTGGRLLLYTDGITDAIGSKHLSELLANNISSTPDECKEKIVNSLTHKEIVQQKKDDDQCFILIDLY